MPILAKIDDNGRSKINDGETYITNCIEEEEANPGNLANGETVKFTMHKYDQNTRNMSEVFKKEEWDSFKEKKSLLVLFGIVCYKDIFKKQHFTKFCFFFDGQDALMNSHYYRICKEENDSD